MAANIILDSFRNESGKREFKLTRLTKRFVQKPYVIEVWIVNNGREPLLLSTSEYITEEAARYDFDIRRPNMHIELGEVPMQRGKRLVQEMLQEKLK